MEKKIPIVEVFQTIQGEGRSIGVPSLFVRVGGCDLRCQFKSESCDTPYAVYTPKELDTKNPALKFGYDKWNLLTVDELVNLIIEQPLSNIVLTGGHPILYQEQFNELIEFLNDDFSDGFYTFEFETQGTIPIIPPLVNNSKVFFNVSVKLLSSNQEPGYEEKRINSEALLSFPQERSIYKFVITNPEEDLTEVDEILQIRRLPVYLMPEGITREEIIKNSPAVVKLAIENNFRFTPREHIVIWNDKKGV